MCWAQCSSLSEQPLIEDSNRDSSKPYQDLSAAWLTLDSLLFAELFRHKNTTNTNAVIAWHPAESQYPTREWCHCSYWKRRGSTASHKTLLLLSCKVPTSAHVMRPIPEPTPSFGYVASIKVLSAAASPLKSRLKARLYNSVAAFESTASIKGSATAAKAKAHRLL